MPGDDEELALTSLALYNAEYSQPEIRRVLTAAIPEFQPLSIEAAFETLARLTLNGERVTPRLAVFHTIVRLAERRSFDLMAAAAGLDRLLIALRQEARQLAGEPLVDEDDDIFAALLRRALVPADVELWDQFVNAAVDHFHLTSVEQQQPKCCDRPSNESGATNVDVQFRVEGTVSEFAPWVNPENWPKCSKYFKQMRRVRGTRRRALRGPHAWNCRYIEVISMANKVLETPLDFGYTEAPNQVDCSYSLHEPTDDIVIDEGCLIVAENGSDRGKPMVLLTAQKTVRFVDPNLQYLTTLSCDTIWSGLVVQMATKCARP